MLRDSPSVTDNLDDLHGIPPGFCLVRFGLRRLPSGFIVSEQRLWLRSGVLTGVLDSVGGRVSGKREMVDTSSE